MKSFIRCLLMLMTVIGISMPASLAYAHKTCHKSMHKNHRKHAKCPCLIKPSCIRCADPVEEKYIKEQFIPLRYIAIAFYKPNYFLPYYYTGSPAYGVYTNYTPLNERITKSEAKYQLSLKTPLWKNIFNYNSSLYFGFSLLTYWQLYNKKAFIRETDYEPDLFIANKIDCFLWRNWKLNFFNYGYVHQSNGNGDNQQRGWDRLYIEAITTVDNWMLSFRPWIIFHKNAKNPDINNYLGYARFIVAYKCAGNVIALEIPNIGAVAKRTSANLTWSFPLTNHLKGFAEVYSGYGQSLIEYNHRTNSAGIGLALSDWV